MAPVLTDDLAAQFAQRGGALLRQVTAAALLDAAQHQADDLIQRIGRGAEKIA